jgi:hypothetical protein
MDPARKTGTHRRRKGGATLRLRGQALTSHPALRRAVACGQSQDSMQSAEKVCSTSSVVRGVYGRVCR